MLFLTELLLCLTHRTWNRRISAILCRAYSDGVINSEQLHRLAAAFDPTQDHQVYGPGRARGFNCRVHHSHDCEVPSIEQRRHAATLGPAIVAPDCEPYEFP